MVKPPNNCNKCTIKISSYLGVERGVDIRAGVVAGRALFLVLLLEVCVEGDAHVAEGKEMGRHMTKRHDISYYRRTTVQNGIPPTMK